MIGKKKKIVKETESKPKETKPKAEVKKNPWAPGTAKYQQWKAK